MKELSIEEKAQRYDEAINVARSKIKNDKDHVLYEEDIADIFPELKWDENEKIRKQIISFLKRFAHDHYRSLNFSSWLAWLEKQGNTDGIIEKARTEKQRVIITETNGNANIDWDTRSLEDARRLLECGLQYINTEIEKQGESKPADKVEPKDYNAIDPNFGIPVEDLMSKEKKTVNKTEPKFHNGEWIVWENKCYKVNYNGCGYELIDQNGLSTALEYGTIDENAHLWNISYARDGDVLACENGWTCIFKKLVNDETFSSYCFMDNTKWFCETGSECHTLKEEFVKAYNGKIYPATKEQRVLLFTKMKEAGYEWDSEKRELKKIEQKSAAWSKEDEMNLNQAIYVCHQNGYTAVENRLKSIKERVTWKLSEEQIKVLNEVLNFAANHESFHWNDYIFGTLNELIRQLKKLREE